MLFVLFRFVHVTFGKAANKWCSHSRESQLCGGDVPSSYVLPQTTLPSLPPAEG